jgi:hypothetical protein
MMQKFYQILATYEAVGGEATHMIGEGENKAMEFKSPKSPNCPIKIIIL